LICPDQNVHSYISAHRKLKKLDVFLASKRSMHQGPLHATSNGTGNKKLNRVHRASLVVKDHAGYEDQANKEPPTTGNVHTLYIPPIYVDYPENDKG
jgi:hypothetical protein